MKVRSYFLELRRTTEVLSAVMERNDAAITPFLVGICEPSGVITNPIPRSTTIA
jgi:hypothetical protein